MMMIPEPWEKHQNMDQAKYDFYKFHACLMEPWDGPASIAFSDGVQIGAVLDRNGFVHQDIMSHRRSCDTCFRGWSSLEYRIIKVIKKGRLEPGRMFMIDMDEGKIIGDKELKEKIASEESYGDWLNKVFWNQLNLKIVLQNIMTTSTL